MEKIMQLVGRILIGFIFLDAGIEKILNPGGTEQYMMAHGMPLVLFFLIGTIAIEVLGGASVMLGLKSRWSALILFFYLIPVTLVFHVLVFQSVQLYKNLAIMGGLLLLATIEPGKWSLDAILKRKE